MGGIGLFYEVHYIWSLFVIIVSFEVERNLYFLFIS